MLNKEVGKPVTAEPYKTAARILKLGLAECMVATAVLALVITAIACVHAAFGTDEQATPVNAASVGDTSGTADPYDTVRAVDTHVFDTGNTRVDRTYYDARNPGAFLFSYSWILATDIWGPDSDGGCNRCVGGMERCNRLSAHDSKLRRTLYVTCDGFAYWITDHDPLDPLRARELRLVPEISVTEAHRLDAGDFDR